MKTAPVLFAGKFSDGSPRHAGGAANFRLSSGNSVPVLFAGEKSDESSRRAGGAANFRPSSGNSVPVLFGGKSLTSHQDAPEALSIFGRAPTTRCWCCLPGTIVTSH
jgi:hypothetical protein